MCSSDLLYNDGRYSSDGAARRRWAAFMALQTHQQMFLAKNAGLIQEKAVERHQEQVLRLLLSDDEVLSLVTERGYDKDFVDACQQIAKTVRGSRT